MEMYYFFLGFTAMGSAVWSPWLVVCFHMLSALWVTYQQFGILHAMVTWKCSQT